MTFKRIAALAVALAMGVNTLTVGAFAAENPAGAVKIATGETATEDVSATELALLAAEPATLSLAEQLKQRELKADVATVAEDDEITETVVMSLGAADEPFIIANANQLNELAGFVNAGNVDFNTASYKMVADVDLSTVCGEGTSWTPIGTYENPFSGSFDGNGHTVAGLYINNTETSYQGLFGNATGSETAIKNLGVINANITAGSAAGIVVGNVGRLNDTVTIENCYATGTITGNNQIGGVAGYLFGGTINNCYNTASVTGVALDEKYIGGVVGFAAAGTAVKNSYNTGAVIGECANYVGGVAGEIDGTAESCFSAGTVKGGEDATVGGIAGWAIPSATLTNCVALNQSIAAGESGHAGAVAGKCTATATANAYWDGMKVTEHGSDVPTKDNTSSTALIYTDSKLKAADADFAWPGFEAASWENVAAATLPTLKNAGGTQSSDIPGYLASTPTEIFISTAAELKAFAEAVNNGDTYAGKTVKLTADIDLSSVCSAGGESWTPIGTSGSKFEGTFDGQNHTISNLYINANDTGDVGLFGYCSGTIKNLGVVNANVTAAYSDTSYVGIIAGRLRTSIDTTPDRYTAHLENCYSTGTVQATESGTKYIGGLVGYTRCSTIKNGYSTAAVTATTGTSNGGGVVGYLQDAAIENCYSTGKVSGSVTGASATGGVVGFAGKNKQDTSITNCVALNPSVSGRNELMGNTYTGAVVGLAPLAPASAPTITGSAYWNGMEIKKNDAPVTDKDHSSSTALTYNNDEGKLKAADADFIWPNFSADIWETVAANTLPTLKDISSQSSDLPVYLMGASDEIYISTAAELADFATAVNGGNTYAGKAVKLTADIDLSSVANWTAIGSQEQPFKGIFDGQGHTVSNMKIDKAITEATAANDQGLFGCVVDGTVKNLSVLNANIKAGGGNSSAGTIVGYAAGSTTIENCYGTGIVETKNATETTAGGIAGAMATYAGDSGKTVTAKNCYSTAKVTSAGSGGSYAGGVVGAAVISGSGNTATVENCYSIGEVTANVTMMAQPSAAKAGGVMGIAGVLGEGNALNINNCLGLNSGVKGYYSGAVLGNTAAGAPNLTGNAYWTGMTVKDNNDAAQAIKDTTGATPLAMVDGYLNNGNGTLDWAAMGFAANGWVAPADQMVLPYFTGMAANFPAVPLTSGTAPSLAIADNDQNITAGSTATLTVTTTGTATPATYTWYTGDKAIDSNKIDGAAAASYTTPALAETTKYTVRVTTAGTSPITLDHTYTVTVGLAPTPTPAPGAPTATPAPGAPTATPAPGAPTATPAPGAPTATPAPGAPAATPAPAAPTATPVPGAAAATTPTVDKYTINAWVTTGGSINPIGVATYAQGQTATYTITPATGYRIAKVTVDGVNIGAVSSYTFKALNHNHEIGAYFEKSTGTVTGQIPQTGDDAPIALWVTMLTLAAAGFGATLVVRRKKQK